MATNVLRRLVHGWKDPLAKRREFGHHLGVLGLPMCKGQKKAGTELAPRVVREKGFLKALEHMSGSVSDFGDVDFSNCGNYSQDTVGYMARAAFQIRRSVAQAAANCELLMNIGGDHSVGMGTVAGHADQAGIEGRDVAVFWIDAHSDINTPKTSGSGSWHGMPVSLLIHEMSSYLPVMPQFAGWSSCVDAQSVVFIGLRDVDPYERYFLDQLGIPNYSMRDIDRYGIDKVTEMAFDAVDPRAQKSLHVSFDVDSLDPVHAPSTGTPVNGGLTLREGTQIAEKISSSGRLRVMDIVEINPLLGDEEDLKRTTDAALLVTKVMLGENRAGRRPDLLEVELVGATDSNEDVRNQGWPMRKNASVKEVL